MKMLSFIMLYVGALTPLYAQMCGGGTHKFEITLPANQHKGKDKELISYEIFAVSDTTFQHIVQAGMPKSASIDEIDKSSWIIQSNGTLLSSKEVIEFMPIIKMENKTKSNELLTRLSPTNMLDKGSVFNKELKFWASEGYKKMYVLQIMTNTQIVYILSNLFGGCTQTTFLLLGKEPKILHIDPYHIGIPKTRRD